MNDREAKELNELLFCFMGLFHEKFLIRFRQHDDGIPGLKKNHAKILGILFQNESLISSEIGRRLDIEKGSITSLIDQLEAKGQVTRRDDPGDRRKSHISLTAAGREEMSLIIDRDSKVLRDFLGKVDAREIREFKESLHYVVAFMEKL